MSSRKQHSSRFKAQVAHDAIKNQRTIAEIASAHGVHPSQVNKWKRHVFDELPNLFTNNHKKIEQDSEKLQAELYQQIGRLKVELDWLKKKVGLFD